MKYITFRNTSKVWYQNTAYQNRFSEHTLQMSSHLLHRPITDWDWQWQTSGLRIRRHWTRSVRFSSREHVSWIVSPSNAIWDRLKRLMPLVLEKCSLIIGDLLISCSQFLLIYVRCQPRTLLEIPAEKALTAQREEIASPLYKFVYACLNVHGFFLIILLSSLLSLLFI